MAETEIKIINGRSVCDTTARTAIEKLQETGSGITTNGKALLRTLLYGAVYDQDVLPDPATTIEAFLAELDVVVPDSGDSGDDTGSDSGGETEKVSYTVTYSLTDVVSSNAATSVTEGNSFTTVLSADSAIDTVTVKMGGVDITETAYNSASGAITIAEVTGDIVIIAKVGDASVLYTLKNASFDGSRYVDTGVCLENEDKDFTVVCDFKKNVTPDSSTEAVVIGTTLNDVNADQYHIMLAERRGGTTEAYYYYMRFYPPYGAWSEPLYILTQADNETHIEGRVIITHAKDSSEVIVYAVNDSNPDDATTNASGVSRPYSATADYTSTVTVGGSGARGKMSGTINEFTIYNRVWSADEISAYLA